MNILLVDDQATVLDGLRHGVDFEKLGYTNVFTSNDAASALKICREESIQVIVSDVEMPQKNGLELLSEIHEKYPLILRIVLTSHPVFSYAQEGLKQGIFDYIVQPAPFSEIENSLRKAANEVKRNSNERRIYEYGNLFKLHENQFLTGIISRLYQNNPQDVDENISLLRRSAAARKKCRAASDTSGPRGSTTRTGSSPVRSKSASTKASA
jgi:YesN/AraC family two-component response regulator